MPTLKCTKCNKIFKTGFITAYKTSGMQNMLAGRAITYPIWPFTTSLVAKCPNCKKNEKLMVMTSKRTKIITVSSIVIVILLIISLMFISS